MLILGLLTRLSQLLKGRDHATEFCKLNPDALNKRVGQAIIKEPSPCVRHNGEKRVLVMEILGIHHSLSLSHTHVHILPTSTKNCKVAKKR